MKQQICTPTGLPNAHVCIKKSRLKVYHKETSPTYYLTDGSEFSLELFNPTSDVVLAKIILNNKSISQGGLVLNPGQRVFLERYLDVNRAFKFNTYEVANTSEVMAAIKDNGDFKVEFFRENKPTYTVSDYGYFNTGNPYNLLRSSITNYNNQSSTTLNLNGVIGDTLTSTSNNVVTTSATLDSFKDELIDTPQTKNLFKRSVVSKKSIETGRVEMGSESDQKLKYVDKSFEYFAFHTITYKMLPISQKINTAEDISSKVYCTQCAHKLKNGYKYCPICATKV